MSLRYDEIKRNLQNFFSEGSLTVVGSGLSCAEGIPGMGGLASELLQKVPNNINVEGNSTWSSIVNSLENDKGLEETLLKHKPDEELEDVILDITSRYIRNAEKDVIDNVIAGHKELRFSKYLRKMHIPNTGLPIITTNYDRLIEVSSELVGIPVDNMFFGRSIASLNEKESNLSFCKAIKSKSRNKVQLSYHRRIKIFKPHGCLGWFDYNGSPISTFLNLKAKNLIITPGLNKFRVGYEQPFDIHREKANKAIDEATKFIIIGYGFNDDHLETHLLHQIKQGSAYINYY
ncbi:SIR2 family protein [Virgibacillus sp. 179-BFC.A HS]|uniref:SIR2 family protein n=1 Tax=Tigheibacillus jepli TaxID=3035914 RepID=A0ABU5CP43_9BACI|nr:SIR2 family protein [Virgibacillus sp. 179-BFC.A HS]MDY0407228.1 SIR2 family protein [Virgibacillus sp. 179-BFC.A HS]